MSDQENKKSTSSSGIGFFGLLTLIFITLKLLEKIDWSWWWVLSPIWIIFIIGFLIAGTIELIKQIYKR